MNKKTIFFIILFSLIIAFVLYEIILGVQRNNKRKRLYLQAKQRAKELKKKLLVIGSPYTGGGTNIFKKLTGNYAYGCGDYCIDIVGCKPCKNEEAIDLYDFLKKEKNLNKYVIFISCVLEYVDNIKPILKILNAVPKY